MIGDKGWLWDDNEKLNVGWRSCERIVGGNEEHV